MSVSPSNQRVAIVFSARMESLQPSAASVTAAAARARGAGVVEVEEQQAADRNRAERSIPLDGVSDEPGPQRVGGGDALRAVGQQESIEHRRVVRVRHVRGAVRADRFVGGLPHQLDGRPGRVGADRAAG